MMYPNNLSFYIRMGIKFGNWKDDIWLRHNFNRTWRFLCDIPYHTVYYRTRYIQYVIFFLYLSNSGTYSTKMDKDMAIIDCVDNNHLNENSESFQVEKFKNLFFCYQILTFSVIWTSLEATKGWHVTLGTRKKWEVLDLVTFSVILIIRWWILSQKGRYLKKIHRETSISTLGL